MLRRESAHLLCSRPARTERISVTMRWMGSVLLGLALWGCAPVHLGRVRLGGERDVGEVFLGGWDGKRLRVFNDTVIEPGVTGRDTLVRAVKDLSNDRFAAVWVEGAKVDEAMQAHDAFCDAGMCLLLFARDARGGLGPVVGVFELNGAEHDLVGSAWLAASSIRPPGPESWSPRCLEVEATPLAVHPDGGAIFPARTGSSKKTPYALFDRTRVPEAFRAPAMLIGFQAPNFTTCDHEKARWSAEPEPERPRFDAVPTDAP